MTNEKVSRIRRNAALPILVIVGVVLVIAHVRRARPYGLGEAGKHIVGLTLDDSSERKEAAAALVGMGASAVEPLICALKHEEVARRAAEVLGRIGDPRAVEPLLGLIGHDDRSTRFAALEAVGRIGGPGAFDALVVVLEDDDPELARIAAEAIGNLADPRALDPLVAHLSDGVLMKTSVAEALGKIADPRGVAALLTLAGDADERIRRGVGMPAVSPLQIYVRKAFYSSGLDAGEDWALREKAVAALVAIGPPAVEGLSEALSSKEPAVRMEAARALGRIADARGIAPLIAALEKGLEFPGDASGEGTTLLSSPLARAQWGPVDETPNGVIVEALAEFDDPRVVPALIAALEHDDPYARFNAAHVLGQKRDGRAFDPLIASLKDEDSTVRMCAASALGHIGAHPLEPIESTRAVEPLIVLLSDESGEVRRNATIALGCLKAPRAIDALGDILKDANEGLVAVSAAQALARIDGPQAVAALAAGWPNFSMDVRLRVVSALADVGSEAAIQTLILALDDRSKWVRSDVATALGETRSPNVAPVLIAALKHKDITTRSEVVRAIGKINTPECRAALVGVIQEADVPDFLGLNTAQDLSDMGDEGVEAVIDIMKNGEGRGREFAAIALGGCGVAALEPLLEVAESSVPEMRRAAADGLLQIKDARVKAFLDDAHDKGDLVVMAGACAYYVRKGGSKTEEMLLEALDQHGTPVMAGILLGCGNSRLSNAGGRWLSENKVKPPNHYRFGTTIRWASAEE